jgi:hypothetical protein
MKNEEPKLLKKTIIPVKIVATPNFLTALNFNKRYGSAIAPAEVTTNLKRWKASQRNEDNY